MTVNYITDIYQLHRVLNSCDRWTQLGQSFLCYREGMMAVMVWAGEIPAELQTT